MKKLVLFMGVIITAISSLSAQLVIDAEMFKANPNAFMGKTVTIKNVVLKSTEVNQKPSGPVGVVSSQPSGPSVNGGAPVGVAGPSSGKSQTAHCNPIPNFTLTKWTLGPNNEICVQADARTLPMLPVSGSVCKDITFRVTPTMYMLTRCSK